MYGFLKEDYGGPVISRENMGLLHRYSLFTYLLFWILVGSSFVLGLVILCNASLIRQILFETQREKFYAVTQSAADEVDRFLASIEEVVADNNFQFRISTEFTESDAENMLHRTLDAHPSIFSTEVIYTPERRPRENGEGFQAIYSWRNGDEVKVERREDPEADYSAEWYTRTVAAKKPIWSEPYLDPQSKTQMVTFAAPALDVAGNVEAVLTADISLEWLFRYLDSLPLGKTGEPIFFSAQQMIFLRDQGHWVQRGYLQELAKTLIKKEDRQVYENLSKTLSHHQAGHLRYRRALDNEMAWMYYRTVPRTGWTVGCVLPDREVLGAVWEMSRWVLLLGAGGMVLLILPSWWIARSVAAPLRQLASAASEISLGRFDTKLPPQPPQGELSKLVTAFDRMRVELVQYIDELTESTRAKERVSLELAIAESIQSGMVPKDFSPAKKFGLDLFATMVAAQEVGGDLYDFDALDDDRFYFCVGDVSGKGVPASLFMAVGKTLLKSTIQTTGDPAIALTRTNAELIRSNDAGLFITGLCGIYDRRNRTVTMASAGHHPPWKLTPDGGVTKVEMTAEFPLAMVEGVEYKNQTFSLPPGTLLFLYTDGVPDAMNPQGEYYGSQRLFDFLASGGTVSSGTATVSSGGVSNETPPNGTSAGGDDYRVEGAASSETVSNGMVAASKGTADVQERGDARKRIESILDDLHRFTDGAKQSDDITLLILGPLSCSPQLPTGEAPDPTAASGGSGITE